MAEPIYLKNVTETGPHPFGEQFGEGFTAGFKEAREKKKKEAQMKKFSEFMQRFNETTTRQEAMSLAADPQYADLFDEINDYQALGQLMKDKFQQDKLTEFKFRHPELGTQSIMVPESKLPDPTQPGSLDEFFASIGAPPGSSAFGAEKPAEKEEFFSDPTGLDTMGYFVPGTEPAGAFSTAEVLNAFKKAQLEEQRRSTNVSAAAARGETIKGGGEVERAIGFLNQQGIAEPTPADIRGAMLTLDQLDKSQKSLEKIEELRATGLKSYSLGDSERFQIARGLLYPLVQAGRRPDQAATTAADIARRAVPISAGDRAQIQPMPSRASDLKEGEVYMTTAGKRYAYIGRDPGGRQQWVSLESEDATFQVPKRPAGRKR